MEKTCFVISAEHGGNRVPDRYRRIFAGSTSLLSSHRGYDIGSWKLSEQFKGLSFQNMVIFRTDVTRLLVDVNRSLWRRTLFSEITKKLTKQQKDKILKDYYWAYRNPIYERVEKEMAKGNKVVHIAIHSFTPVLNGEIRNTDIGLLYNPERYNEKIFSRLWKNNLRHIYSDFRIRFNYPYRGKPDGLAAHFRKQYNDNRYLGIEFEVNQKFTSGNKEFPSDFSKSLIRSFENTCKQFKEF